METAMQNVEASSSQQINVLIVIDTDYVKAHYGPNSDPNKPVGIDHNSQFMICTNSRGPVSGQGSADLKFSANPGDNVTFAGVSIYNNSDDAVFIYGIKYWNGDQVFNTFVTDLVTRQNAVMPNGDTNNGLPATKAALTFSNYSAEVRKQGTENFYVWFALYELGSDGETQNLYGYYYWDPSIKVN
jgi:hypothetical protein